MRIIIRNIICCKKCGDVIESKTVHNFRLCSCGAVAVDGGHDYLKRSGNPGDFEDLSETLTADEKRYSIRIKRDIESSQNEWRYW